MGWGLKIGLFLLGIVLFAFGAWIITVLIFGYLFLSPLLRRKTDTKKASQDQGPRGERRVSLWNLLGGILLLLSSAAVASGGRFSPIVLACAGFLTLSRKVLVSRLYSVVRPVDDSVLLRGSFNPFKWFAVAEAKVSTRDPAGALSGVEGRLLFVTTPAAKIYLVFSGSSFTRKHAEEEILRRLQRDARVLRPLGVYLLPLDGREALDSVSTAGKMEPPNGILHHFLANSDYGAFEAESKGGIVSAYEVFARGDAKSSTSALGPLSRKPTTTAFLSQALKAAFMQSGPFQPDSYVEFLSSLGATEGETLGQRITQTNQVSDGELLQVAALNGPQVKLSPAQYQAVLRIYE
jgi:hypothetical protein